MRMSRSARTPLATALACAGLFALALVGTSFGAEMKVTLSGGEEVPPVTTQATGTGTITVNADKTVSGSVMTKGVNGTAAHIHAGAKGKNGPVAVPLTKSGDSTWTVAAGAKLTDAQLSELQAGNMYVNVHSAAHPDGEIRGQIPAGK